MRAVALAAGTPMVPARPMSISTPVAMPPGRRSPPTLAKRRALAVFDRRCTAVSGRARALRAYEDRQLGARAVSRLPRRCLSHRLALRPRAPASGTPRRQVGQPLAATDPHTRRSGVVEWDSSLRTARGRGGWIRRLFPAVAGIRIRWVAVRIAPVQSERDEEEAEHDPQAQQGMNEPEPSAFQAGCREQGRAPDEGCVRALHDQPPDYPAGASIRPRTPAADRRKD